LFAVESDALEALSLALEDHLRPFVGDEVLQATRTKAMEEVDLREDTKKSERLDYFAELPMVQDN